MFTHATEGVSILLSLESVSTFGRVYLDEFICPELTELVHFVSCIALMQMYLNDFSMIQTICAISAFFVAAIYQVLRILITPIIFIVCRVFYLSCVAANSRASRTVTRNNHESNIERLDMILYNTASTFLISTPLNVRFISHRISSALDNFIVNGKRILVGYPGIENPSPSRVLITISKRHINSYIIDSSTSHAKSLSISFEINRRGMDLQQEMVIRACFITATLPRDIFHTPMAYRVPLIEEGTRVSEVDEAHITTNSVGNYHASSEDISHEECTITSIVEESNVSTVSTVFPSLSGLDDDCETVNTAEAPIQSHTFYEVPSLLEPISTPDDSILYEEEGNEFGSVDTLGPGVTISENNSESITATLEPGPTFFVAEDKVPIFYPVSNLNPARYTDDLKKVHPCSDGQANSVFQRAVDIFYEESISEIDPSEGMPAETPQERILYSLVIIKVLLNDIFEFAEELYTSRGARVEGSFRSRNEAVKEDPTRFLLYYCYNIGCDVVQLYHGSDSSETREIRQQEFKDVLYKCKTDINGNLHPGSIERVLEAYKFGSNEEQCRNELTSEKFSENVQIILKSSGLDVEIGDYIDYLGDSIRKIHQNIPINFGALVPIMGLYKFLKKVFGDYKEEVERRNFHMEKYRDFISWVDSMDAEQAHKICKDKMNEFAVWEEDEFNNESRALQKRLRQGFMSQFHTICCNMLNRNQ